MCQEDAADAFFTPPLPLSSRLGFCALMSHCGESVGVTKRGAAHNRAEGKMRETQQADISARH